MPHNRLPPSLVTSLCRLCPRLLSMRTSQTLFHLQGPPHSSVWPAPPHRVHRADFFGSSRISGHIMFSEKPSLTTQAEAVTTGSSVLSQAFPPFFLFIILYSFSPQIFIEHLLCVRLSSRCREYNSEQHRMCHRLQLYCTLFIYAVGLYI